MTSEDFIESFDELDEVPFSRDENEIRRWILDNFTITNESQLERLSDFVIKFYDALVDNEVREELINTITNLVGDKTKAKEIYGNFVEKYESFKVEAKPKKRLEEFFERLEIQKVEPFEISPKRPSLGQRIGRFFRRLFGFGRG